MIQIDMPMPKSCCDCYFARGDYIEGVITLFCMTPAGRKMYDPDLISRNSRPEWCPLKEADKPQEIVLCKNCKQSSIDSTSYPHYWCSAHWEYHDADWFCADGIHRRNSEEK